jgi:hypothetical protein
MFQPSPYGERPGCWNNHTHQISPDFVMTDRSDKPPILRALLLLVALVGVALSLAALSPQSPDGAAANDVETTASTQSGNARP